MPVIFDYKCTNCGHSIKDHILKSVDEDAPMCPICDTKMEKLLTGFSTPNSTRHHNKLPKNYKFSKGGVNFGRM